MIYMWFTGINYYKLAFEKDRDSIFMTIWKPGYNAAMHSNPIISLIFKRSRFFISLVGKKGMNLS
jgi:hypothetical protein